jgi:hypothetical protein
MLARNWMVPLFLTGLGVGAAAIYFAYARTGSHLLTKAGVVAVNEHSEAKIPTKSSPPKAATSPSLIKQAHDPVDRFQIVEASAKKALDGDGKAARIVATSLWDCLPMKVMYGDTPDPRTAFLRAEAAKKNLPQWVADRDETQFRSCERFFKEDPFAGLPPRDGGYMSIKLWTNLAYQYKDPVALTEHVSEQMMNSVRNPAARHDPAIYQALQPELNQAAESGDPEALFRVGMFLVNGSIGEDTIRASAVQLAACNLGYDCTPKNEFAFGACLLSGNCQEGDLYTDRVRQMLGEGGYAKAYALAQQLETALAQHDTVAIDQIVRITPPQVATDDTSGE